jgi:signal transduction histidine kinase
MSPPQEKGTFPPSFDTAQAAVVDSLPLILWTVGADGHVEHLNATARGYTGLDDPADFERAVHPDDLAALRERCMGVVRRGEPADGRCRLRRESDGTWRWHAVRILPARLADGAVSHAVGTALDDHERHTLVQANQALLASEQRAWRTAEDAARMKDEFLAALGHELRTPLNAIAGWTSLLKRGISGAEATRAIEVIERNSQLQRDLIGRMLDASRILSGHVRLDLQVLFLEDEVALAVESIRSEAEARGLSIRMDVTTPGMAVNVDPARLQQVLGHLLDNAVRFTPHGGQILVTQWHQGGFVHLAVSDTGSGIAPALLPGVFDRFRAGDAAAAHRHGGLGLGLSIVRHLVQMHGGQVEAASDGPGLGATFTISLPVVEAGIDGEAAAPAGTRAVEDTTTLRGLSILVIEDDPDSREMLSVLLENVGAVPVAAATVGEGLRLLGDLEIDVVLSDIGMPGRDGFDLIRALRAFPNPRVQLAPALAVTAFSRDEDRERILAAGFDAHVGKPVEPRELFAAIGDAARRRSGRNAPAPDA